MRRSTIVFPLLKRACVSKNIDSQNFRDAVFVITVTIGASHTATADTKIFGIPRQFCSHRPRAFRAIEYFYFRSIRAKLGTLNTKSKNGRSAASAFGFARTDADENARGSGRLCKNTNGPIF